MNTIQLSTEIVTRLNAAIENGESRLNQQAIVQGCIEREIAEIRVEADYRHNPQFPSVPYPYPYHCK